MGVRVRIIVAKFYSPVSRWTFLFYCL